MPSLRAAQPAETPRMVSSARMVPPCVCIVDVLLGCRGCGPANTPSCRWWRRARLQWYFTGENACTPACRAGNGPTEGHPMTEQLRRSTRAALRLGGASVTSALLGTLGAHFGLLEPLSGFILLAFGILLGLLATVFGLLDAVRSGGLGRRTAL